ncbi:unnamed protein product [Oikopleura dioica]|uniref:Uncharacterized protein n=1 Tax=Oikopleura dioica TaxID=34765 RepID=E4Z232_OIKDI|nr:unnamed protein product [Oikopleura dioica]
MFFGKTKAIILFYLFNPFSEQTVGAKSCDEEENKVKILDIVTRGVRNDETRETFLNAFFDDKESRTFFDLVFGECADAQSVWGRMEKKSKLSVQSVFNSPGMFSDNFLSEVDVNKMLLLGIWSIVEGYSSFGEKIQNDFAEIDDLRAQKSLNSLLLDENLRTIFIEYYEDSYQLLRRIKSLPRRGSNYFFLFFRLLL